MLKLRITEFKSDLKNDKLCSLLLCKFNQNHHCYEYAPSAEVLQSAKKATVQCNKSFIWKTLIGEKTKDMWVMA
jgi:hypothetical protein